MKVVIVMTYFERQYQLNRTLASFRNSVHNDFEVIIVDDCSPNKIELGVEYPFPITVLRTENKKWTNPEPAYNLGLIEAMKRNPDVIIVQNAECYHVGDVISHATTVTDKTYFAFSCFSIDKENTFKDHNIHELISKYNRKVIISGALGWYNHPRFRHNAFDFCAAMTVNTMKRLNGYDERFSDGYAMGDNYLIARVRMMNLNVTLPVNPFVVHQWHYTDELPAEFIRLYGINKILYNKLVNKREIRAQHKYTKDLV